MKYGGLYLLMLVTVVMLLLSPGVQAEQPKTAGISQTVSIEIKDVPVAKAIDILFQGTGCKYSLKPGITGRVVELKLHDVTFEQALAAFTEAADLDYTLTNGVYVIGPSVAVASTDKPVVSMSEGSKQDTPKPQTVYPPVDGNPANTEQAAVVPVIQQPPTQVIVHQEAPNTVITDQPSMGGPYSYGMPYYPIGGNFAIFGGNGYPVVVAGRPSLFWRREHAPIPPPGYVSADVMRFLRGQAAMETRVVPWPIY